VSGGAPILVRGKGVQAKGIVVQVALSDFQCLLILSKIVEQIIRGA
jgi:hypothetical protein